MSVWDEDLVDPFLAEISDEEREALARAVAQEVATPPVGLRERLVAEAALDGRFDRYAPAVAALLDIDEATAKTLLDGIGQSELWYRGLVPDVDLYDVEGGPSVTDAITGFLRLPAGTPFPEHGHLGTETSLIVQGSATDDRGTIWRPGDVVVVTADEVHSFRARPGPDLVFLVVAQQGVRFGDTVLGPHDPRM